MGAGGPASLAGEGGLALPLVRGIASLLRGLSLQMQEGGRRVVASMVQVASATSQNLCGLTGRASEQASTLQTTCAPLWIRSPP